MPVKRGGWSVSQRANSALQPNQSTPHPRCTQQEIPSLSPQPARQACPTSSRCQDLPLPTLPPPLLSQQLHLDFYFHLLNERAFGFQGKRFQAGRSGR